MGEIVYNMLSSFVLNPKRTNTIRCELKNHHIGSNALHFFLLLCP